MSYSAGEAKLLTVLTGVSGFSADAASRGKWGILNKGRAARYAIVKPGDCVREWLSPTVYQARNRAVVQVWERYKDDGDTLTNLEGYVAAIEAAIMAERRLGDSGATVLDANVVEVREAQEMWTKGGGPQWLKIDVIVEWIELEEVTFTD